MEQSTLNTTKGQKVVLTLLGIEKQWVRSKGEWVDASTLLSMEETTVEEFSDFEEPKRKWWKFWGK
ncbi:MAG: hypothetical protein QNK23_02685 [Crocinitomicaceae bacterium]|nr:hypothetical protein [Crocinitomicaceae bacterium]